MRLLEATWNSSGNELYLWGESFEAASRSEKIDQPLPASTRALEPTQSPVQSSALTVPLHPFCCNHESLAQALLQYDSVPDRLCLLEVFLPGSEHCPLSSPNLLQAEEVEHEVVKTLLPWQVPALALSPVTALSFLSLLPSQLPPGLKADDSLKFWREATKLLLELLTRGKFLPGIIRREGHWHSVWRVLPNDPEDHHRLSILAESMPPICRALRKLDGSANPEPSAILESFISSCSDALIRSFLARHSLLDGINRLTLSTSANLQAEWLSSLTQAESLLKGADYDLANFEKRLRAWAGGLISVETSHQLRTAFRLLPPPTSTSSTEETAAGGWIVEFFLQSVSDSKEELSARQIWQGDPGFLRNSDYSLEDLEEILLRDLGRALSYFPELRRALVAETHPSYLSLSIDEAYSFLRDNARRLEQLGFAIILPQWWKQPQTKLGLHLNVSSADLDLAEHAHFGFLSKHQLLDYSWEVSIGDSRLSVAEFEKLVEQQTPLFALGDKWIELQPTKLARTLDFLKRGESAESRLHFADALRLGLGVTGDPELLPVVGLSASGWIKGFLEADSHLLQVLKEPVDFKGSLRSYQREGLSWLTLLSTAGVGGCLADDMGLGKTIQLLALLLHERETARESEQEITVSPTLLIVPMSILANWERETERFAPSIRIYLHHGPNRLSDTEFRKLVEQCDMVITTYSLANRDEALFASVNWGRIALDEAQNIKNIEAKQTQAVRRLARNSKLAQAPGSFACHRVALTGTPLENHLQELWSIFDFLNPGFLGSASEFRTRFVLPIERFRDKESATALSRLIGPFVLRRLKSDPKIISDLPEKIEMEVYTALTEEQALLYQQVVEQMMPQVDLASGIHRKGLVLATITRLKQICNHPALFLKDRSALENRSGKLSRLEEIFEVILAEGDKVLLFTQYAQMGHLLKPYLQERFGREVLFLHGALAKTSRDKIIERFQKPSGPQLFILSLKAGGFGLNLTEANQVIHLDQWWNPAVEAQATDRAYRIGQKRSVQVRKFVCKGTLEEKIVGMLAHKKELAAQVVGSTKNVLTQLSTNELRNLLELTSQ